MKYQVNIETCWLAGIWAADRGSLAKGVVSINNKSMEILSSFEDFCLRNFDIENNRIRKRIIKGFGISNETYFTRMPARRFIEFLVQNRHKLSNKKAYAYLAGRLDGDGSVDSSGSIIFYYYGNKEKDELKIDANLIQKLGFKISFGSCGKKALRLRVLRPRFFALKILPYVRHPKKKENLEFLIKKRRYGA